MNMKQDNIKACENFLKKCHKNLWKNIQAECRKYLETKNEDDLPDFIRWYGTNVKYVSIKSKLPYNKEYYLQQLKYAIENEKELYFAFEAKSNAGRDRSYRIEQLTDGSIKGFYSSEYANCGNGDYFLIINPTTAMFYERD